VDNLFHEVNSLLRVKALNTTNKNEIRFTNLSFNGAKLHPQLQHSST
jgi:hypothetical protein